MRAKWFVMLAVGGGLLLGTSPAAAYDFDNGNAAFEVVIQTVAPVVFMEVSPSGGDATLVLRVTTMVTNSWFDATAPYHPSAVGVYSRLGRRPPSEYQTNANMNVALLHASYHVLSSLLPRQQQTWRDMMTGVGLDPGHQAPRRILLDAGGITPGVMEADDEEHREKHQPVSQACALLNSSHVLGDEYRKRIDQGRAVTHSVPDAHHGDARDLVHPEGERERDDQRHERQVLLGHPDRAGSDREQQDASRDQYRGTFSEPAKHGSDRGIRRSRRPEDSERAADDEDEKDDLTRSLETVRNRSENRGWGKSVRLVERCVARRYYLLAPDRVRHPLERSLGKKLREGECQQDHPEQQDERVRNAESGFRHRHLR